MALTKYNELNTLTEIANASLVLVKEQTITNIDSDEEKAVNLRQIIAPTIFEVQGCTEWYELSKEQELILASSTPTHQGWKFHIPQNVSKIEKVFTPCGSSLEWEIDGQFIWARHEKVFVKFYRKSLNPAEWCDELKSLVVLLLSARIATYLSEDFALGMRLEDRYNAVDKPRFINLKNIKRSSTVYKPRLFSWRRNRKYR